MNEEELEHDNSDVSSDSSSSDSSESSNEADIEADKDALGEECELSAFQKKEVEELETNVSKKTCTLP